MASSFQCCSEHLEDISDEYKAVLMEILPPGYDHLVCEAKSVVRTSGGKAHNLIEFKLCLRQNTKEAFHGWRRAFQERTLTTYRISIVDAPKKQRIVYGCVLVCQHNNARLKPSSRRMLSCESLLQCSVKAKPRKDTRSQDIHIHEWPLRIRILWGHSHPLKDAAVLRYRDVNPATRHRILQLFDQGYSNNTVINLLMYELVQSKEKAHALGPKDRSIMPDFSYINRVQNEFKAKLMGQTEKVRVDVPHQEIVSRVESMAQSRGLKAKAATVDSEVVVALVTPIMERVHLLAPQSGEFVFLDTTGMSEKHGCCICLLITHSPTGGLPLGCLISTSDSAACIEQGLRFLLGILPEGAFFSKAVQGPVVFLTTGLLSGEGEALKAVFPTAKQARSSFHIVRNLFALMYNKYSLARTNERVGLLNMLKGMLLSPTIEEVEEKFETFTITARSRHRLIQHFTDIWTARQAWAIPLTRIRQPGHSSENSFHEIVFQNLDSLRHGLRVDQLFSYVSNSLTSHHGPRIVRLLKVYEARARDDRLPSDSASVTPCDPVLQDKTINQLDKDMYEMHCEGKKFLLDVSLGVCTCKLAQRFLCGHLLAIQHHLAQNASPESLLMREEQRLLYLEIATGHKNWQAVDSFGQTEDLQQQTELSLAEREQVHSQENEEDEEDAEDELDETEVNPGSKEYRKDTLDTTTECQSLRGEVEVKPDLYTCQVKPSTVSSPTESLPGEVGVLPDIDTCQKNLSTVSPPTESFPGEVGVLPDMDTCQKNPSTLPPPTESLPALVEIESKNEISQETVSTGFPQIGLNSSESGVLFRTVAQVLEKGSYLVQRPSSCDGDKPDCYLLVPDKLLACQTTGKGGETISNSSLSTGKGGDTTSNNSLSMRNPVTCIEPQQGIKGSSWSQLKQYPSNKSPKNQPHENHIRSVNSNADVSNSINRRTNLSRSMNSLTKISENVRSFPYVNNSVSSYTRSSRVVSSNSNVGTFINPITSANHSASFDTIKTGHNFMTNQHGFVDANTNFSNSKNTNWDGSQSTPRISSLESVPVEAAIQQFDRLNTCIKEMLRENPESLLKPFQTFVNQAQQSLDSYSSLAIFLSSLGTPCRAEDNNHTKSKPLLIDCTGDDREFRSSNLLKRSAAADTVVFVPAKRKVLEGEDPKGNSAG